MNSTRPVARYCVCVSAAVACAAAMAMRPPEQEVSNLGSRESRAAYLDCARISSGRVVEPDLVTLCFVVADAPLQRDFNGHFELQLQWCSESHDAEPLKPPGHLSVH
jgi:hypothetical protein